MATKVRGITISIGGDSSGLTKALKDVDKACRDTQSQLKDVNRLLKLDPGNTELIAQKQRLLGGAVSETKAKLDTLKTAAGEAKAAMENGDAGAQKQYDALQREIVKTTDDLKQLETQAKQSASTMGTQMQAAGAKMSSVGDKISSAGSKYSSTVTAGVAAVGAASMAAFEQVDSAEDEAVRKTGATGDAAKALEQSVEDVGGSLAAANSEWSDVGDAVGLVSTKFGVQGDALSSLSEQFLMFAQTTGTDATTAVDEVGLAMDAFGVPASQANDVLGLIQDTMQTTGIDAETLMGDLNTSGAAFREMGFGIGDATQFMGALEKEGVPVDQALAGLKKAAANCSKEGKDMGTEMRSLADRLKDPATSADASKEAIALFGSKSGLVLAQAMADGKVSLDGMSGDLSQYGSTVQGTFDQTVDGADRMKQGWKQLQEAGAELGGALGDTLAPVIQSVAGFLKGLADGFAALPAPVQQMIVTIALIVAAIGPILMVVGGLISSIGAITTALGIGATAAAGATAATAGIGAGLLGVLGPIALVVLAIAAIILIIQNWGAICDFFGQLWQAWSQLVVSTWQAVEDWFAGVGQWWTDRFDEWGTAIQTGVTQVGQFFGDMWDGISTTASNGWNDFTTWASNGMSGFNNDVQSGWDATVSFFSGVPGWMDSTGSAIFSSLQNGALSVLGGMGGTVSSAFWGAVDFLGNLWGTFQSWGSDAINGFASGVVSAMSGLISTVSSMASQVASFLHFSRPDAGPLRDYERWMPDFIGTMASQVRSLTPKMADAMGGISASMVVSPAAALSGAGTHGSTDYSAALASISSKLDSGGSDVVMPVYIGTTKLDEVVLSAQSRANLRSGGR
jgi:phage-related minor tail protein